MPSLNSALMGSATVTRFRSFAIEDADEYECFLEGLCGAVCQAHYHWRLLAHFRGIVVNGSRASGGTLEGPGLESFIRMAAPQTGARGDAPRVSAAVASGLSDAWRDFQRTVRVPDLVWYPTFAAVAGPSAAPVPNRPTPLAACAWDPTIVSVAGLTAYLHRVPLPRVTHAAELLDALATGFAGAVEQWLAAQMIMNVIGRGPVPGYAPPEVPTAPVVAGDTIVGPGHLAS